MFIGLLIFLSGHRHFQSTRSMDKKRSLASNLPYQYGLVSGDALFSPSILPCCWRTTGPDICWRSFASLPHKSLPA